MIKIPAILLAIVLWNTSWAAYDMRDYIQNHSNQSAQTFLENFPYDEYLREVQYIDFPTIQEDRFRIWQHYGDGDGFLYYLADYFIKSIPVTLENLETKISIGEAYLNPLKTLGNPSQPNLEQNAIFKHNTDEAYTIIGYYLLSKVAEKIEVEYNNKSFDPNEARNRAYIQRLNDNKVFVSLEPTTIQKFASKLRQGKIDYIWDRIKIKYQSLTGDIEPLIIWGVIAILGLTVLVFPVPKLIKVGCFFPCLALTALQLTARTHFNIASVSLANKPTFTQQPFLSLHPFDKNKYLVNIYTLQDNSGNVIGRSIWLQRPQIKAKYFAFSTNSQFQSFRSSHNVVLATSGGYTTNFNGDIKPDGFTVENGQLSNAVLLPDRQGLAIFYEDGIRAINLRSDIRMPGGEVLESPLKNVLAYSKFLSFCKEKRATVFQTHLLAFGDSILISSTKAPSLQRERRLLALCSDRKGNVTHVIFDIPAKYELALITKEVYNIISSRGLKVEGILNLDTGSYDILNVFDEAGNILANVQGPVSITEATNLIIYYR
jgi:hypothetical protein